MTGSPLKEVLDVLSALEDVEWARCVGGEEPLRPPFLVWRFKKAVPEIEAMIVEAVNAYSGATRWTIYKGERNWVIETVDFCEFARTFRVDVDAIQRFGIQFPTETLIALADGVRLGEYLRRALLPN